MNIVQPEVLTLNIGDADIQYLHYRSDGPPLVMLHATGLLPWMWHPIAGRLASRYRVIAPYFCDHREVEPEEGGVNWMLLASDLARLCERLSLEKPLMVGHSMGATVIAIAYAEHGMPAERMVLIEPIFPPPAPSTSGMSVEQHPLASRSIKRRNAWSTEAEARDYLRSKSLYARWDEEMMDLYLKYGMTENGGGLTLACHPRQRGIALHGRPPVRPLARPAENQMPGPGAGRGNQREPPFYRPSENSITCPERPLPAREGRGPSPSPGAAHGDHEDHLGIF